MKDESISLTVLYPAYNSFEEIQELKVVRIVLLMLLCVSVFAYKTPTFLDGTFEEGYGVSLYVTPEGELRTLGNDWDLNDDGWLDAVVINEYKGSQDKYETWSYVFWGGENGFDREHCDSFFTSGAECAALADFDRDGWTDIVVANSLGESMHSYVIYGSPQGYTHAEIDSFKAKENHGAISVADLNKDGWLDLVWSDWFEGGDFSTVFWGDAAGFSEQSTDSFPAGPTHGNVVADFDGDGYADILWAVYYKVFDPTRRPSLIFWGGEDGYKWGRRTELACVGPGDDISVADLNRDGILDIVIPNHSSEPPTKWTPYDYSYIHYGQGNRQFLKDSLYAHGPWASSVADIDGDDWLDIVFACSSDDHSIVYYGSSQGFSESEIFPIEGATCALLSDFDDDGDCDMVLGRQAKNQLYFYYQDECEWESKVWYGPGGVDAGITLDLGNPATRLDEYCYISPAFTVTEFLDSVAVFHNYLLDYNTTWKGQDTLDDAYVELWVSSRMHPYTDWREWTKVKHEDTCLPNGRIFRYKLCFHTGFRTSIVLRRVELNFYIRKADEVPALPQITQLSGRLFDIWLGQSILSETDKPPAIYDLLGRLVYTLTPDSWGKAYWFGEDNTGKPLPAGVYFLVIQGWEHIYTYKLVLFWEG
jgi:hypothetical protein